MEKSLESIEKYIIYIAVLTVTLFILPIFPNPFATAKIALIAFSVVIVFLLKAARMIASGKLELSLSSFDFALLILAFAYAISGFIKTPNRMEAFFLPGTASYVIFSFLFYFLVNQLNKTEKKNVLVFFAFSATLLSLTSLLSISGIMSSFSFLPVFMRSISFTFLGGNLPTAIFLAIITLSTLGLVKDEKTTSLKAAYAAALTVIVIGLCANIYNILPGKDTAAKFASSGIYWSVAVDSLKESPVFGIGPGNYISAFNRYRPIEYNQTDLWAARFTNANSFLVTSLTEVGMLGLAGIILLSLAVYRSAQQELREKKMVGWGLFDNLYLFSLVLGLVLLALFPATPGILFTVMVMLAVNGKAKKVILHLKTQGLEDNNKAPLVATRIPAILVSLPIVVLSVYFFVLSAKYLSAEYYFKQSLDALARNDGAATYDLMSKAINTNPLVDRYHSSFAQVNFALANNIALNSTAEEITDEERATISTLIQQTISEAKAAVALNPTRAGSWEMLAGVYRNIIAFAQGADQFSVQSYAQAIALDPVNPNLRIALGGVYYALNDYPRAIETFKLAVLTKPDHPNARYNLAIAYRDNDNIEAAIAEMTNVLSLVDPNSQDYEIARQELESLEEKRPTVSETEEIVGGEELNPPQPIEEVLEPPLELPEDAAPDTTETDEENAPEPTPTIEP